MRERRGWPSIVTPERVALLVPLLLGALISWFYTSVNTGLGETGKVAVALLSRGELADPYIIPTGPTAHVSPAIAGFVALVYGLLGIGTAEARFFLGLAAAAAYAASALVAIRILREFEVAPRLLWLAAGVFAFMPFALFNAVVWMRQWDQPFAALILLLGWLTVVRARRGADPLACGAALGALGGMGGLVSPSVLPPLGLSLLWLSWLAWRGRIGRRWWPGAALGGMLLAAFLLPWGLRNQHALGHFILTRSNFGLERAVGNAPPSVAAPWQQIHPFQSIEAAQEVARVGEVAFMRTRKAEALSWIGEDIQGFVLRSIKRSKHVVFPARKMVDFFPIVGPTGPWIYMNAIGFIKLLSFAFMIYRRCKIVDLFLFLLLPALPYTITHINIRYSYLVYFCGIITIVLAMNKFSGPRGIPILRRPRILSFLPRQLAPQRLSGRLSS